MFFLAAPLPFVHGPRVQVLPSTVFAWAFPRPCFSSPRHCPSYMAPGSRFCPPPSSPGPFRDHVFPRRATALRTWPQGPGSALHRLRLGLSETMFFLAAPLPFVHGPRVQVLPSTVFAW